MAASLAAFAKQIATVSLAMYALWSGRLPGTQIPQKGFLSSFIFGIFTKICRYIPI
jgi:hypothetical protein